MTTVTSADGTTIAYDAAGRRPAGRRGGRRARGPRRAGRDRRGARRASHRAQLRPPRPRRQRRHRALRGRARGRGPRRAARRRPAARRRSTATRTERRARAPRRRGRARPSSGSSCTRRPTDPRSPLRRRAPRRRSSPPCSAPAAAATPVARLPGDDRDARRRRDARRAVVRPHGGARGPAAARLPDHGRRRARRDVPARARRAGDRAGSWCSAAARARDWFLATGERIAEALPDGRHEVLPGAGRTSCRRTCWCPSCCGSCDQTTRPWRMVFSVTTRGSTNWSR